jgi:hypothetical protein
MDTYEALIGEQMDRELHLMGARIVGRDDLFVELEERARAAKAAVSDHLWSHPEVAIEVYRLQMATAAKWGVTL